MEEVKLQKKTLVSRSQRLWKFLEKRPFIAPNRLSVHIGYDPSNFHKAFTLKKTLTQEVLLKAEKALESYGLTRIN